MLAIRLFLITFVFMSTPHLAFPMEAQEASYDELLARLKGGDTGIDYAALRLAFAKTPDFAPYGGPSLDRLYEAVNNDDYGAAIAEAETILEAEYVNMDAHFVAAISYEELGDAEKSAFHNAVAMGLHQSIFDSGDGRTADSPHIVINVAEEYAFLRLMGLRQTSQALVMAQDGRPVDAMEIVDVSTGESMGTVYFDVSISFAWMGENLP